MCIPLDILKEMMAYFSVKERYCWSLVSKDFKIQQNEWQFLGLKLKLMNATRERVKSICQRDFNTTLSITSQKKCLWSNHLEEPLQLFTPWCTLDQCRDFSQHINMYVRDHEFVQTVHKWADNMNIQGPKTSIYSYRRCIVIPIWKNKRKRLISIYKNINGGILRKTRHILMAFRVKGRSMFRALVEFKIWNNQLQLYVKHLEFLVKNV